MMPPVSIPRLNYRRFALAAVVALALAFNGQAAAQTAASPEASPIMSISTENYDVLLHKYVDDSGLVRYAALKEHRADLDAFIADMDRLDSAAAAGWNRAAQLAFWINAYNAITLQRILDHYPIDRGGLLNAALYPASSIRQINGVWTKLTTVVLGQSMTLDHIEHEILRKQFGDPRIHAAIVCAARGCPPLRAEAFRAEIIDAQLDDQCARFLGPPHRFQIDRARNVVYLSPILKWFAEDFVAAYGARGPVGGHDANDSAALHFARQHINPADADFIANATYRVRYLEYDWSLNEQP